MEGLLAVSVLLQAFVQYVKCSTSTTGHYFQKTSGKDDDTNLNDGDYEIYLKEEFFTCNGEKACSSVAKSLSSGYQILGAGEALSKTKEAWKKLLPAPLGKSY